MDCKGLVKTEAALDDESDRRNRAKKVEQPATDSAVTKRKSEHEECHETATSKPRDKKKRKKDRVGGRGEREAQTEGSITEDIEMYL